MYKGKDLDPRTDIAREMYIPVKLKSTVELV
jgi:hypothetical protein